MPRGITAMGLGRYLSKYKDRVVDGHRIRKRLNPDTRAAEYALEALVQQAEMELPQ